MMNKKYISQVAEAKIAYHKKRAKMPYEEKIKIIIELQKLECEMIKSNPKRKSSQKIRRVWQIS